MAITHLEGGYVATLDRAALLLLGFGCSLA
jgi:hypothetical protein